MCFGGGGDSGGDEWREAEEARQRRIKQGEENIDKVFAKFDDDFYDTRRQALIDYETPQIDEQYKDALGQLAAALARSGLGKSSIGADRRAKGQRDYDFQQQEMLSRANQSAGNAEKAILAARDSLSTNNIALADPSRASNAAISSAESLTKLPKYEPLLDLFADLTEGLATQADLERRKQNRYQSGLFNTSPSARTIG